MTISVLLADDQPLVRTGLRTILEDAGGSADLRPDVVLMDVRMPRLDGVLVLTTFDLDEYVYAGLRAGAGGFLLKDALAADLISAIRVVVAGDAVVAPSATRRLVERFLDTTPESHRPRAQILGVLTDREREVLPCWPAGCPTRRSPPASPSATASRPSCWPTRPASSGRECEVNWAIRSLVVISARS